MFVQLSKGSWVPLCPHLSFVWDQVAGLLTSVNRSVNAVRPELLQSHILRVRLGDKLKENPDPLNPVVK